VTGQLPLFGRQYVHVGLRGICIMCKVSLAMAELYDDCGSCRGRVEPVPPRAVLGAETAPLPLVAEERAA
jgi:hypothetical protein